MISLILYLLESSVVLACLYMLYILILRKETFFNLNRFFLIAILAFSLIFPLVSFDFQPTNVSVIVQPIEEISKFRMSYYDALAAWEFDGQSAVAVDKTVAKGFTESFLDWKNIFLMTLLAIYAIGAVVCLSRTVWTMKWIWKLILSNPKVEMDGVTVVKTLNAISPFSFLKYVFVQKSMINTPEFDQIMAHERTHINEKHSLDLIFVQLLAAFLWFNPVIWQLIKSLKTTHEYIADKKIINQGYSLVEYQTLLLSQLISNNSYGLVHNFNLSFIKKRIIMMKNKKSGWSGKVKVAMVMIGTLIFSVVIARSNSTIVEQVSIDSIMLSNETDPILFYLDGNPVSLKRGLKYSVINEPNFKGELKYVIRDDISKKFKNSNMTITLVREGRAVIRFNGEEIIKEKTLDMLKSFKAARAGDALIMELDNVPEPLPKIITLLIS